MKYLKEQKWVLAPLAVLVALAAVIYLSYTGTLPFDFNTVRGYTVIGVIGVACLALQIVAMRRIPKKEG